VLKIRTESGKNTIMLRLSSNKKMIDVYNVIKHFSETRNFEIMSNFPRRTLVVGSDETLLELDLHPNANLNLKEIKE